MEEALQDKSNAPQPAAGLFQKRETPIKREGEKVCEIDGPLSSFDLL